MIDYLFSFLQHLDNFTWAYLAAPVLLLLGVYFSLTSKFIQVRKFPSIVKMFFGFLIERSSSQSGKIGIKPIHAFFASVGGCIGVGNIIVICTAVQVGGPGALFWVWITALFGTMLKYAEVYLGMRHRITNTEGGYSGGPMYYLQKAMKARWIPPLVCLLLCIYGAEPFLFSVITHSVSTNFGINKPLVIAGLLVLIVLASSGGIKRIGKISSMIIPLFIVLYLGMSWWVIFYHYSIIPAVLSDIFTSAFTGHAAVGGFLGSSMLTALSQGARRACYSSDIGTGYPSVIHSESSEKQPEKQAVLAIIDVFLDTFVVCTTSVLLILVTGIWKEPVHESMLVQIALGQHFPFMHFFIPFFVFLLGYSTLIVIFCVGIKCARFVAGKLGEYLYYAYAIISWILFSYVETAQALILMSLVQGALLLINCYGIYRLRKEVSFNFEVTTIEEPSTLNPVRD